MKKFNRVSGFVTIILVLMLVGLIGVSAYLIKTERIKLPVSISTFFSTPTPTPSPTQTPDETANQVPNGNLANWKTYTNTKYNYLFKYPPGFTFVEGPAAGSPPEVFQTWDTISFDSAEFGLSVNVNRGDAHGNPIICSTDEECKSKVLAVLQKSPSEVTPFSSTVFGKIRTGFKYEISNPFYTTYPHYLVFLENGELWEISIYKQNNLPNYNLVNQILSTFKFSENESTNIEGKFCGGIAANLPENQCPEGYHCKLDGNYPDAGGTCVKN